MPSWIWIWNNPPVSLPAPTPSSTEAQEERGMCMVWPCFTGNSGLLNLLGCPGQGWAWRACVCSIKQPPSRCRSPSALRVSVSSSVVGDKKTLCLTGCWECAKKWRSVDAQDMLVCPTPAWSCCQGHRSCQDLVTTTITVICHRWMGGWRAMVPSSPGWDLSAGDKRHSDVLPPTNGHRYSQTHTLGTPSKIGGSSDASALHRLPEVCLFLCEIHDLMSTPTDLAHQPGFSLTFFCPHRLSYGLSRGQLPVFQTCLR